MKQELAAGATRAHVTAIALLVIASALAIGLSECPIERVDASFSSPSPATGTPALVEPAFTRLAVRLDAEQQQNSAWAYAALVGIITISVVKRVLPSPWMRWAYICLAPAAILLLQAIRAGVYFEQRLAYLAIHATMTSAQFMRTQEMLRVQFGCLESALAVLIVFVGSFIVAVVVGKLHPADDLVTRKEDE